MESLAITRDTCHGEWNDTIQPILGLHGHRLLQGQLALVHGLEWTIIMAHLRVLADGTTTWPWRCAVSHAVASQEFDHPIPSRV